MFRRVNSNTGTRGVYGGGNYHSNDNYGFFYFNANNNPSNTNTNLGSRLLVYLFSMRGVIHATWQKYRRQDGF